MNEIAIEDYMWLGGLKLLVEKGKFSNVNFIDKNVLSLLEYSDF